MFYLLPKDAKNNELNINKFLLLCISNKRGKNKETSEKINRKQ